QSSVRNLSELRTVAPRGGPISVAKSHLKLVAPTEILRTVAPGRTRNSAPGSTSPRRGRGLIATGIELKCCRLELNPFFFEILCRDRPHWAFALQPAGRRDRSPYVCFRRLQT